MVEKHKCNRCEATNLFAMTILDPVTSKLSVVFKCTACYHLHWVDSNSKLERASEAHEAVAGH